MSVPHTMTITVLDRGTVTAVRHDADGDAGWTFIYAPGAGSNIEDPFGRHVCGALAARGVTSVRFQFPYMEAGRRMPDRTSVLEATWCAVVDAMRPVAGRLCIGGRSMGGRIASMAVAGGVPVDALALFAYPLHPPGRPDQRRDGHLSSIPCRTLFCSGTNDAFASPDELRDAASLVKRSKVHLLAAADHGFAAPKASGRTRAEIYDEAATAIRRWLVA